MKRLLITVVCLLLGSSVVQAQVVYDLSVAPISVTFLGAGETETHGFEAGSSANRVLLVFVAWRDRNNNLSGCTYNSVAMTAAGAKVTGGSETQAARLYYLAGPASGTNNIACTMGAGDGDSSGQISAWVASGVDQVTPVDGYASNTGSGATANIVSSVTVASATNDMVAVFHATKNGSGNISATPTNYTERQDAANGSGYSTSYGDAAGAASVATSATWSNGAFTVEWAALGINVNAAAAGGTCTGGMPTLGAGKSCEF